MNAIHARSQLRYSPMSVDLEIRENPYETAVMLPWPSRGSQENGSGLLIARHLSGLGCALKEGHSDTGEDTTGGETDAV